VACLCRERRALFPVCCRVFIIRSCRVHVAACARYHGFIDDFIFFIFTRYAIDATITFRRFISERLLPPIVCYVIFAAYVTTLVFAIFFALGYAERYAALFHAMSLLICLRYLRTMLAAPHAMFSFAAAAASLRHAATLLHIFAMPTPCCLRDVVSRHYATPAVFTYAEALFITFSLAAASACC